MSAFRAVARRVAAALGLRGAPASEPTRGPISTGDSARGAGWQKDVAPPDPASRPRGLPPRDRRLDPNERNLPVEVQHQAEQAVADALGIPSNFWRCPCGGRPFVAEAFCPRCGRSRAAAIR
jgi:hypothetical protein